MFYLLPYSQLKNCFLDNWIPSAYSILTVQVMANLHGQSKKGGNRRASGDAALYESPRWAVLSPFTPIPAALLSHFKSSLRYSSLAGWSLMCIHSCDQTPSVTFSTLVHLEGSSPEGSLASTACVENASVPKAQQCVSKELLHGTYWASLSLQAAQWEKKLVLRKQKGDRKRERGRERSLIRNGS